MLICVRERPRQWPLWFTAALGVAWAVVDGSYVAYNKTMQHPMLRVENARASAALYFLAGVVWLYRGSLRQLAQNVRHVRIDAPKRS